MDASGSTNPPPEGGAGGRSAEWKLGMMLGGVALAGFGIAIIVWPMLLIWLVGGAFVLLGLILGLSGILARSR